MEFKYLDKNVRYNSSSKSVPLLGFEFSKFGKLNSKNVLIVSATIDRKYHGSIN
jgi:hypothetical protein